MTNSDVVNQWVRENPDRGRHFTKIDRRVCECGHTLIAHVEPTGDGQPWGECEIDRCLCREAWVKETDGE